MEIYTIERDQKLGIEAINQFLTNYSGIDFKELAPHLFTYSQEEAVSHVMRVAGGLDSLVIG